MKNPYEDIINLPHHVSQRRPQMPLEDRAAQFNPFAALTGHAAAIHETARLTDERIELDEDAKHILDEKLRIIQEHMDECPEVSITYFRPDTKKAGGSYTTATGCFTKINEFERAVFLKPDILIPIDDIYQIECSLFDFLSISDTL